MELEVLARPFVPVAQPYPFTIDGNRTIHVKELLTAIVEDVRAAKPIEIMAARFHKTIAAMAVAICNQARESTSLNEVALSGGVWQNRILLKLVRDGLNRAGFVVYSHQQVPTNDGGLSLGQVVVANHSCRVQELSPATTDGQPSDPII
jgi:hydrogenase maturation protein HypF